MTIYGEGKSKRGPYGTNEGDVWTMEGSPVGEMLTERDNLIGIHEMMRDKTTGKLEEKIYCMELDSDDPEIQAHIAKAREGDVLWRAEQAINN